MSNEFRQAQVYQLLALNDRLLQQGCISPEEHDFIRHVQTDKLTKLHSSEQPQNTRFE